ncbi:MAG: L-threonylcarbamoyladenylate synthase [Armatimonadota bacterium]
MQTVILQVDPLHPDVREAGEIIRKGGLVVFPTETVYGLAADALSPAAVARVYEVKGRPAGKPLPVQVASPSDIFRLAREVPERAARLIAAFFPGPLTIVLHAAPGVPEYVTAGTGKVGIRMPDHPVALALIRAAGTPIVAPSANPSDAPPPTTAGEAADYLAGRVDMILDAGPTSIQTASTVVDATEDQIRILRAGSITEEAIKQAVACF